MYAYTYDEETGGILLNTNQTEGKMSKEPRPVYAAELDILGFDKFWKYDKQNDFPYMWAEANCYFYRGRKVASIKGGDVYHAPQIILEKDDQENDVKPEPEGKELRKVDLKGMVKANRDILEVLEVATVKKIKDVYEKYREKLDCFHVAFSGGKDSIVLLNLVKKTLPLKSYVVIFGDTGMEFPDTYKVVQRTQNECEKEGVPFYIAKSHLNPHDSWGIFAPPASVLRWCCSVHKSTPQTLKIREITGKVNYTGLDFVGVRKYESFRRSTYVEENFGKKQKGQYSHNSILDWSSVEIWLYTYANNLIVNDAYKKGLSRAGCLICPMARGANDYVRHCCYTKEIDWYLECVKNRYNTDSKKNDDQKRVSYVLNGGWNARKNGRDLLDNPFRCIEREDNENLVIRCINPSSNWREWIKTLGDVRENGEQYYLSYDGETVQFTVKNTETGYEALIPKRILKDKPAFGKYFRQVFRKATYCIGCRVCETNCKNGCISFINNSAKINNCIHCHECHNIDSGCLLFHSLRHPQGGGTSMSAKKQSLNSFADHAPKTEWLKSFFSLKDDFFTEHSLGPMMFDVFRRFLKDAGLNEKNRFTPFAELISNLTWDSTTSLALMLINLVAENPQIRWYVKNLKINKYYSRQSIEDLLTTLDVKEKDAKSIVKAFGRIVETPFGTKLNFGCVEKQKGIITDLVRYKCVTPERTVMLYGLYKFAEQCGNIKEFTVTTLLDEEIERIGVSPTEIFGVSRDELSEYALGLATNYPEFIYVTFTHDLEKIALAESKTSKDVLELFKSE